MPRPRKMTEEKIEKAKALIAEGMDRKDIAAALGVSTHCLRDWVGPKWTFTRKPKDPVAEPQA